MKYLLYGFYLEALISIISAVQSFFSPANFLKQFSAEPAPIIAIEMTRWYGVLLFVLVYLLVQALRLRGVALTLTLQALLIGDVFQIVAAFITARALGSWSTAHYMSVILSAIYAVLRIICLWKPTETGLTSQ